MTAPASDFFMDNKSRKLVLGNSFKANPYTGFHTTRYDFKPASIDKQKEGLLEMGSGNEVTISLPHTQASKTPYTVYKGSKKSVQKECVLIYDNAKGEFTLERISSQIQVKKTRDPGNATFSSNPTHTSVPHRLLKHPPRKQHKSTTLTGRKSDIQMNSDPVSSMGTAALSNSRNKLVNEKSSFAASGEFMNRSNSSSSSNKSSSEADSGSSSDENDTPSRILNASNLGSQLQEDLELSESGSDSD